MAEINREQKKQNNKTMKVRVDLMERLTKLKNSQLEYLVKKREDSSN